MKIFDCFLFFNELDLLELRLNVLNDCVDYFVIVESATTFQGEEKEFFFEKNRTKFAKFESKLIYFKLEKYVLNYANLPYVQPPKTMDEEVLNTIYKFVDDCPYFDKEKEFWWGNDFFQRECIWRALAVAAPEHGDLILLSDVDEIPAPEAVENIKLNLPNNSTICLRQHEFCYYLNYYHDSKWVGTCGFLYTDLASISLNAIRVSAKHPKAGCPCILGSGGWHFTSIGSIASIKKKIKSWGHRELNTEAILKNIEYNVRHGYDIFRRPGFGRLEYLQITDAVLPAYLVKNATRYAHLVGPILETENIFRRLLGPPYFFVLYKFKGVLRRLRSAFTAN